VEELVDNSKGKIRADKVHERLVAMGFRLGTHDREDGDRGTRRRGYTTSLSISNNKHMSVTERKARTA
jgi:hypothetical protein